MTDDGPSGGKPADADSSFSRSPSRGGRLRWFRTPSGLTFLVVGAFVVVGGYARLWSLGGPSVWNDEAQSTLLAFSILQHGYPIVHAPHLINNWEPLYPYFEAASVALLGHSNFAYRIPSALLGIALIPLACWVGMRLRDRYVGISLAAMVAFSTEYIGWSRQARWYTLFVVLMVLGLLAVLAWSRVEARRTRWLYGLAAVAALLALAMTSLGLFLLYLPGILAGVLAYVAVVRWDRIRRFFEGPKNEAGAASGRASPLIPYRYRGWILVLIVLAVGVGILVELQPLSAGGSVVVSHLIGFPPYPPVWSPNFGAYLVDFYPAIVVLSFASVIFIARQHRPIEVGLLVFSAASFVSVSIGASVTNNIAAGNVSYERHLVPLLFFLFLLSALSIVGIVRYLVSALDRRWPSPAAVKRAAPALYGLAIVVMLVVPSGVVPTSNVLNPVRSETPVNTLVPWVAFSVDPTYPWMLYQTLQPNYELAAGYVGAHRSPGDVVGATNTGPPSVYLGNIQYWVRGNAIPTLITYVHGEPEFHQTGSRLISNTSQLEALFYASPGWFISDIRGALGPAFPGGMSLVVKYYMTEVGAGSDPSITLYHWKHSTPTALVQSLVHQVPRLNSTVGTYSVQGQIGWAVTIGVTVDGNRDILEPIAPYLLPLIKNETTRGHGVLFNVYNQRTDLEAEFPEVVHPPYSNTRLLAWGCEVASGALSDPDHSTLAPYQSLYCG